MGPIAPVSSAAGLRHVVAPTFGPEVRMCTRVLHLRVEFEMPCRTTAEFDARCRSSCVLLGRRVLAAAEKEGLQLHTLRGWQLQYDSTRWHWNTEWAFRCIVSDDTLNKFARLVQDEIMTPAVGSDHVTKASVFALGGSVTISP